MKETQDGKPAKKRGYKAERARRDERNGAAPKQKPTHAEKELAAVQRQMSIVRSLELKLDAAKSIVKERKAELDGARSLLDEIILDSRQTKLPFDSTPAYDGAV